MSKLMSTTTETSKYVPKISLNRPSVQSGRSCGCGLMSSDVVWPNTAKNSRSNATSGVIFSVGFFCWWWGWFWVRRRVQLVACGVCVGVCLCGAVWCWGWRSWCCSDIWRDAVAALSICGLQIGLVLDRWMHENVIYSDQKERNKTQIIENIIYKRYTLRHSRG